MYCKMTSACDLDGDPQVVHLACSSHTAGVGLLLAEYVCCIKHALSDIALLAVGDVLRWVVGGPRGSIVPLFQVVGVWKVVLPDGKAHDEVYAQSAHCAQHWLPACNNPLIMHQLKEASK